MPNILPVLKYGHPVLNMKSPPVSDISSDTIELLKDMVDTMSFEKGIGLAAPQVGKSMRMIVIQDDDYNIWKLINPVILASRGKCVIPEGCLSIPKVFVPVERPAVVDVEYLNEDGKKVMQAFISMGARVVQHEIDHLDGKLILDRFSPEERQWILQNASFGGYFLG